LISLARNFNQAFKSVFEGNWDRNLFIGEQLSKKKLGIVGLGRLGKIIANYGTAFNMKILYYDPYVDLKKFKKCKTLVELVQNSDYISINVPLNKETENLFDALILNKIKKGAKIINTSRGKILNEEELTIRLKNGLIGGYATDVLSNEVNFSMTKKISDNKLFELSKVNKNIIITPHIGGATSDSMIMAENFVIRKFINTFKNAE
jgi:D-3-phosphoglycerate dehydrogenase